MADLESQLTGKNFRAKIRISIEAEKNKQWLKMAENG
jgi:hypothetical protein